MTAGEMITKAKGFSEFFINMLQDESTTQQSKQLYFMDNQDELRKYMGALQKAIEALKQEEANDSDEAQENDELLARAETVVANLKQAIGKFQAELTIDSDVTEADVTPTLTEETIGDAMKNNKTTQNIAADMEAISQQKEASAIPYNYMLVCDGVSTMISAQDKQTLEMNINAVVDAGNYKSIRLFKMTYTPVPLKTRTILSV
jgi:hypothetical protein